LRPFEESDSVQLGKLLNRHELIGRRYLPHKYGDDLPLSSRAVENIIDKWVEGDKQATMAIISRETEQLVGYAGMGWGWDAHSPWLSVVIDPRSWRRGFGSEALELLLVHLFGSTVAHSISAWLPEWNREGLAFARAHGFAPSGRIRRAGVRDGAWYDTIPVELLRREWLARRGSDDDAA
jgi:RimJ/RimL family protein N-acetyltransferase